MSNQIGLGGTTTNFRALDSGEIQLYWEYTGTAWLTLSPQHEKVITDPQKLYERVSAEFRNRHGLVFMERAPLNNTYVLLANPEWAERTGVKTLSEFSEYLADSDDEVTIAMNAEFQSRPDGWPGLTDHYGFADDRDQMAVKNIESGLLYQVIGEGTADVGVGFNTDPRILQFDLVVLDDDRQFFPVYNAAPLVNADALDRHPSIREPLDRVTDGLTTDVVRRLNKRVALDKENPQTVARNYLERKGIR